MKQPIILIIKFVTCIIAFGIGLDLFFDATFVDILTFSLFITIVSYVLGEGILLPQLGKRAAAVGDFLLTYLSVWIFGSILLDNYLQIAWGSIISATLITLAEVFIHLVLYERTISPIERRKPGLNPSLAFGTEFAEEEEFEGIYTKSKQQK